MKLDGEKLLADLESLVHTQGVAINGFKKIDKFGAANDWMMMRTQAEQIIMQIKSGDYTVKDKG